MASTRRGRKVEPATTARTKAAQTKFTPVVRTRILQLLNAGNYRTVAARGVGIHPDTLRRWLRLGRRSTRGPYREFLREVRAAETYAEALAVGAIQKQMGKNWRAALAYLERKFPKRWGARREGAGGRRLSLAGRPMAMRLKHDAEFLGEIACVLDRAGAIESVLGASSDAEVDQRDSASSHGQASGVSAA